MLCVYASGYAHTQYPSIAQLPPRSEARHTGVSVLVCMRVCVCVCVYFHSYMFSTSPSFNAQRVSVSLWTDNTVGHPSYNDVLYSAGELSFPCAPMTAEWHAEGPRKLHRSHVCPSMSNAVCSRFGRFYPAIQNRWQICAIAAM